VKSRADAGGHSASTPQAVVEMDDLWIYDNSQVGPPKLVIERKKGAIRFLADDSPTWLTVALDLS